MRKGKRIILSVLLVLVIAVAGAGIYFYPTWKAAKVLEKNLNLADFSYEAEVELNQEKLESGQVKVLETLSKLTGVEQEAMYNLTIRGNVWEDKIHALIYPKGAVDPFIELYLSKDMDVINEAMLYNIIRSNLLRENAILNFLVPIQEKNMYMTLEQVEKLFGIDLDRARDFSLSFTDKDLTTMQYFAGLAAMSRSKQENGQCFEMKIEQAQIRVELSKLDTTPSVTARFYIEDPAEALEKWEKLFSGLGITVSDERLEILKSLSVTIVSGEGKAMGMPTEFVNQDIIDLITRLRELFAPSEKGTSTIPQITM